MKKKYIAPEFIGLAMRMADIITTSGNDKLELLDDTGVDNFSPLSN